MRKNNKTFHSILVEELQFMQEHFGKDDSVVFLGDIFDSRSSVDYQVLNDAWTFFINLSRKVKEIFILVGNHDLYYKETNIDYVNCRFLRFDSPTKKIANVEIVSTMQEKKIQGKKCLLIPWVDNEEQKKKVQETLKKNKYDVVFGHFDSIGLYSEHEEDTSTMFDSDKDFSKSTHVLSGHYHKRCERGSVLYVGSLINSSYNDVGDVKGFYCINDENELEFIRGNSPRFEYININSTDAFIKMIETLSDDQTTQLSKRISGNFIKLLFFEYNKRNEEVYKFIKSFNPKDLSIGYEIQQFEEDMEDGFEGFNSKADITEVITQFLDKVEDQIPKGIHLDDIKKIVQISHQKFKIEQEAT
jgi:DNA repair exonuclease SbcCD nuclease subunit